MSVEYLICKKAREILSSRYGANCSKEGGGGGSIRIGADMWSSRERGWSPIRCVTKRLHTPLALSLDLRQVYCTYFSFFFLLRLFFFYIYVWHGAHHKSPLNRLQTTLKNQEQHNVTSLTRKRSNDFSNIMLDRCGEIENLISYEKLVWCCKVLLSVIEIQKKKKNK